MLDFTSKILGGYFKPQHRLAFGLLDDLPLPPWFEQCPRFERHKFMTKPKNEGEKDCIMIKKTTFRGLEGEYYYHHYLK